MGHDYVLVFTQWLDGHIWFKNNGLLPPWFTPSFCAGQPFFADPQSAYYSFPQFLDILVGPVNAAYWTLCICAALLFWGGYLVMRRVFATGPAVAILVGAILMFNGFLPHRLLVGHMAFHGFALIPWIALLLMMPVRDRLNSFAAAIAAGVLLAYWVHSGFGTLILAGALSIGLMGLIYAVYGGSLQQFFMRGCVAGVVGIGLSLSKLWAAYSFLSNYPRTFYSLPGAATIHDGIIMILGGLFLPSEWAAEIGMPRLTNLQWALSPHEWAYNFSFVVALLILALAIDYIRKKKWRSGKEGRQVPVIGLILLLGLAWPLAFNVWDPTWNTILKSIPIINSASTPIRWIIVYIPIVALIVGLWMHRAAWGNRGIMVIAASLVAIVGQTAFEPRDFYTQQGYDVRPTAIAEQMLSSNRWKPAISYLGTGATIKAGQFEANLGGNDTFVGGVSQVFCYNPVFGYRLEKYSPDNLAPGSILLERNRQLNMKNPACYVFPNENSCRPGDLFRADQLDELKKFAAYQPYAFKVSDGQAKANIISAAALIFVILTAVAWLAKGILQKKSQGAA